MNLSIFTEQSGLLDAKLRRGVMLARNMCSARAVRADNAKLALDNMPSHEQGRLISFALLADALPDMMPPKMRADAVSWSQQFLAGSPTSLASHLGKPRTDSNKRSDASTAGGGGNSDLDGIFTFQGLVEGLVAPFTLSKVIPVVGRQALGVQGIRVRRKYYAGEHKPIAASGGQMGSAALSIESGLVTPQWYGTERTVWRMEAEDAAFAGYDLQSELSSSLRWVAGAKQEDIGWNGDSSTGLYGLLNFPGTAVVYGASLDIQDPDSIVNSIIDQVANIKRLSHGAMMVNKVVLSTRLFGALAKMRSNVAQSALAALQEALDRMSPGTPGVIMQDHHLDATGPAGEDGILYMDDRHGEDGLHQIALGPLVVPVNDGMKTILYYVTKQAGVFQPMEHACTIAWHALTGV